MRPSLRAVTVAAMFGLLAPGGRLGRRPAPVLRAARGLLASLKPGGVALVTGPSGSGKSRVLAAVAGLDPGVVGVGSEPAGDLAPIDHVDGPIDEAMRLLARAGLADADAMIRPARSLSDGERWRLRLALAMRRCEGRASPLLIADEFCSVLDRATAAGVAGTLRRWAAGARVRVVCATAHGDLETALAPDVVVRCELGRGARVGRALA